MNTTIMKIFVKRITKDTGIKITVFENQYGNCRFYLPTLHIDDIDKLSQFIRSMFTEPNLYTHRLAKLQSWDNTLCLTIPEDYLRKAMEKSGLIKS